MKRGSKMDSEKVVMEAANKIHGTANDTRLWDGWRTYGAAWAAGYLLGRLRSGAEVKPGTTAEALRTTLGNLVQTMESAE
jgi:hypothetical protein